MLIYLLIQYCCEPLAIIVDTGTTLYSRKNCNPVYVAVTLANNVGF